MKVIRTAGVGTIFFLGVAGSIATGPVADVSGVSDDVRLTLDANNPSERITAVATVDVDAVIASGTGQIGLSVTLDNDAEGSLAFSLTSETTGSTQGTDIVDTQAQGTARVGIDAFEARCAELASHYGHGFALTDAVKATIRKFEPVY